MLSVTHKPFILNVTYRPFILCVVMLNVAMLNVVMLNVAMLNVVMQCFVMLSFMAPYAAFTFAICCKNSCDCESGFTYLGYLGQSNTNIETILGVLCCLRQGTLTEGEGSVRLTSLCYLVQISCF
jgi:hypothetical protein